MDNQKKDTAVIGDFLKQVKRQVRLEENKKYKLLGVRWYGQGMFLREEKIGKEIKAEKLYKVHTGDFVYNRLFAWKSSFAIVEEDLDGCLVSNEFPTFEYDQQKIDTYFLLNYVLQPAYIDFVNRQSGGMSSVSRKRFKEEDFLQSTFPNYSNKRQKLIAVKIRNTRSKFSDLSLSIEEQLSKLSLLRQTILQEVIEGKLTADWRKKNPKLINGENHASKLLEKIKTEKEQLIKDGKIKKGKKQVPSNRSDILLNIPNGWAYPDLDDITKVITDGTHQTPNYVNNGRIFLSAQNVKPFRFMPEMSRFVSEQDYLEYTKNIKAEKDDLLVGRVGSKGETAVIDVELDFAFYVSLGLVKTFKYLTVPRYLAIVMNSPYGFRYASGNMSSLGASAGNLNLGHIRSFPIPFPPLAEQQVIVEWVDKLMAMVDELEKQVTERKDKSERLMQSVLREAFEHKE